MEVVLVILHPGPEPLGNPVEKVGGKGVNPR